MTTPPPCPPRPVDAHKGIFGTVIVIGGCATMIGAPALCASAALRAGVGLVKVATCGTILPTVLGIEPGATGVILGPDVDDNLRQLDEADLHCQAVLAVGPGLGQSPLAGQLVDRLLRGTRRVVLDADGLNLLAKSGRPRPAINTESGAGAKKNVQGAVSGVSGTPGGVVMTPHPGEYGRLARPLGINVDPVDPATRSDAALQLARAHQAIVVLKGCRSLVSDGQRVYENTTGNPALATAGSGDILTGVIAALMAGGMASFDASVLGVYLHGWAADLWADRHGVSGMTARDLAALIPDAFDQHRRLQPPP